MSDDNKTNEELLEEVKKLRQLEENRDKKAQVRNIKLSIIFISLIVFIFCVFFLSIM